MRIMRWLKLSLLAILTALTSIAFVACGGSDEGAFTGFRKGCLTNVVYGTEFRIKEYVDFVADADYKIVLSSTDGSVNEDLTKKPAWDTREGVPGDYKLTYEVLGGDNKGVYTLDFKVVCPQLKVVYKLGDEDMKMTLNKPLNFASYFRGLDFQVVAYLDQYEIVMNSVTIGDVPYGQEDTRTVVDLTGQLTYTPTVAENHYFKATVSTPDGQSYSILLPVRVVTVGDQVEALLKTDEYKNMTIYGETKITNDIGVSFRTGFTRSSNARNDIGYVGFKGNYGKGTYLKFDFTGNNLPKVAFFVPSFVNGLTGGDKGLLLNNGTVRTATDSGQSDCSSFAVCGPNKISTASYNGSSNLWADSTAPISWNKLKTDPTRQYTYIVGVKDTKDANEVATGETPYVIFEVLVYDRNTMAIVYQNEIKVANKAFVKNYFTGSIQAYGAFGVSMTFDKVYPVQTGINSIWELYDGGPMFAENAPTSQPILTDIQTSAYATLNTGDVLGYIETSKITTDIIKTEAGKQSINKQHAGFIDLSSAITFQFPAVGSYTLYYQTADRPVVSTMVVTAKDPTLTDFEDGVNLAVASYGTYSANGIGGTVAVVENVGVEGNHAVEGTSASITNIMNLNFAPTFLNAAFTTMGGDYITFDMLCDLPYLRFAREGGGYYNESGTLVKPGNTYIVADANDVGFMKYTKMVGDLYSFSLVYPKAAWNKISVNGTIATDKILSTIAIDFSAAVDLVTPNGNKFTQPSQNVTKFYIDNIRVGKYNSADMTFADGVNTGNFNLCNAAWGSTSIVAFGNDYALEHTTKTETANSETTAFRVYTEYLHEVFNVAGASALTFKVYVDPEKVDAVKFAFFLSDGTNKVKTDEFTVSAFDTTTKSYTVTITKELYSKYYDANGNGIEATLGATKALVPCLWMNLTKGGATTGFATVVTFDDFVKVMPQA